MARIEFDRLMSEMRTQNRARFQRLVAENPGYLAEQRARTRKMLAEIMATLEAMKQ